jgi:hypothetical protein
LDLKSTKKKSSASHYKILPPGPFAKAFANKSGQKAI